MNVSLQFPRHEVLDKNNGGHRADLAQWRRISLEKQLPRRRFLTGIGAPSIVCASGLTLLAVFSVFYLGQFSGRGVPKAVTDSQRQLVSGVARGLSVMLSRSLEELTHAATGYGEYPGHDPRRLISALGGSERWRGLAVLAAGDRKPLAAAGEAIGAGALPAEITTAATVPFVDDNDPRVLLAVPLADGRLLAAEAKLAIRSLRLNPEGRQAILVALPNGETALAQGAALARDDPVVPLLREVVAASDSRPVTTRTAAVPTPATVDDAASVPVLTAAAIGDFGLFVVSVVHAPLAGGAFRWQALAAGGALLLAAILVLLIVWSVVVRPVRRLLDVAKGAACGEKVGASVRWRTSEVRRIAAALTALSAGAAARSSRSRRASGSRVPGLLVVSLVTAMIVGVAGAVAFASSEPATELPNQVVTDSENQLAGVASAIDDTLTVGYANLAALARQHDKAEATALVPALRRFVERDHRYRSVYLLSADGRAVAHAGRDPLRGAGPVPGDGGVRLHNVSGRLPIIYAYSAMSAGRALVAEYDVRHLSGLLDRMDGRLRVVDVDGRTILDTEGYRAFTPVSTPVLRAAIADALSGAPGARVADVNRTRTLIVTSPISSEGSSAHLEWSVIAERTLADFDLPRNRMRRGALLTGVVAVGIALLFAGWYFFFLVRPLRKLAADADSLVAGKTSAVITPQRQDEIGAVAVCLEICRQLAVHGEQRAAGAVRLRGAEGDYTVVMPRIPARRKPHHRSDRVPGRKRR